VTASNIVAAAIIIPIERFKLMSAHLRIRFNNKNLGYDLFYIIKHESVKVNIKYGLRTRYNHQNNELKEISGFSISIRYFKRVSACPERRARPYKNKTPAKPGDFTIRVNPVFCYSSG
jgi:hypothetical protein